jgi:predicted ester cyclase
LNFRESTFYEVECMTSEVSILRRVSTTSDGGPMSAETNKELVRRVIEEGTSRKNLAVFDELVSPSFVDHETGSRPGGPEDEKELLSSVVEAFPDWRWDVEEMLAVDDKVIPRYVARGTHRGEFTGAAPTGKGVAITGINIARIERGKIVESWGNSDQLGWMRQIGVVPAEVRF